MNFKKLFAVATLTLLLAGCGGTVSEVEAENLATDFINSYLLSDGRTAEITNIEKKSGVWSLEVTLSDGTEVASLLSLDGKLFIPEAYDIEDVEATVAEQKTAAEQSWTDALASIPKNDKPVVELFVMSYCPFGTQAEKAAIPALEALGDSIDFQLKFVDYAMHGAIEVEENLREYAISQNFPAKLIPYLKAFLESGDSATALAAVEISESELADTIAAADSEFEISKNLDDQTLWLHDNAGNPTYPHFNIHDGEGDEYGIRGSPSFVVNGQFVDSVPRNSATMLELFCAGFENAPEVCSTELSTATPATGFGGGEGASSGGECS